MKWLPGVNSGSKCQLFMSGEGWLTIPSSVRHDTTPCILLVLPQ